MTITITLTAETWDEIKAQGQAMFSAPVVIVSEAASPVTALYESGAVSVSLANGGAGGGTLETKPKRTRAKAEANNSPPPANNSPPEPEADAPFADAPADPPASSSEAGSDEPASGTATPASDEPEVTYDDVTRAVLQVSKDKGPDAVRAALSSLGLTTARGTEPSQWPAILAAMQEAGA